MCNVSFQLVFATSDTHISYGDTTASSFPSETDRRYNRGFGQSKRTIASEPATQTPLTPTASATVDTKKGDIFDVHAMDDKNEPWLSETDHRTGWNKEFNQEWNVPWYAVWNCSARLSETSCITRQDEECADKHAWLCLLGTKTLPHWRNRFHCSAQNRWADIFWSVPRWMQRFFSQRFECAFHQNDVQNLWYCSEWGTSSATTRPASCSLRHTDHRRSNAHTRKTRCVEWWTYIDSVAGNTFSIFERRWRTCESCVEAHDDHEATTRPRDKVDAWTSLAFCRLELWAVSDGSTFLGLRSSCVKSGRICPMLRNEENNRSGLSRNQDSIVLKDSAELLHWFKRQRMQRNSEMVAAMLCKISESQHRVNL